MRELLEKILALPRRIEPLGGQNYSYVCLEDITGLIEAELVTVYDRKIKQVKPAGEK